MSNGAAPILRLVPGEDRTTEDVCEVAAELLELAPEVSQVVSVVLLRDGRVAVASNALDTLQKLGLLECARGRVHEQLYRGGEEAG